MSATAPDRQEDLLLRVQDLQARLDAGGDSPTRRVAEELLSTVIEMYGEGLERIVAALGEDGEHGQRVAAQLAEDDLVASLLLIHDLHPVPLRERVLAALEHVRPYMESHGGDVELLSLQDGVARLRLRGSCSDCAASAITLELAIKQALEASAPDLAGLEVEGVAPPPAAGPSLPLVGDAPAASALELPVISSGPASTTGRRPGPPVWVQADHLDLVPAGRIVAAMVGATELVVANVEGTLLAFENGCANCGGSLEEGNLEDGTLVCPSCGRTYFLPSAGRSLDDERLQLVPLPLLREQGHVKVATQ